MPSRKTTAPVPGASDQEGVRHFVCDKDGSEEILSKDTSMLSICSVLILR